MFHPAWRYPIGVDVPLEQGFQPFLWASEWYKLFQNNIDDKRASLTWRDLFAKVRQKAYVYYTPTDELFRPFNYSLEMAANNADVQPNVRDWAGFEDLIQNAFNREPMGTYAWAIQELTKGRVWLGPGLRDDFKYGGWGFNQAAQDEYYRCDADNPNRCTMIPPSSADAVKLKSKPFFSKDPGHAGLYTDQPVTTLLDADREELLANEIPALTTAVGHRGVEKIKMEDKDRDIDIRIKYAVGKPWPADRLDGYEWRHADVYNIAYPYLSGLYNEWSKKVKGE